ncbi:protein of unknown function [Candidatus Nitrosocosmicus franklandus]|uniref:Uncharacterized protein n=1 Tax=Candidatus Nitrosocosmicus franklandianus TaxID=1798806 RepID=A0A484I718_9ARCH|nr:protein of unknown function [Candidatus Nitrosocosmicus franklandus]
MLTFYLWIWYHYTTTDNIMALLIRSSFYNTQFDLSYFNWLLNVKSNPEIKTERLMVLIFSSLHKVNLQTLSSCLKVTAQLIDSCCC